MRSRNKLAVSRLPDFIAWAEASGWFTMEPKSCWEAWRGERHGVTAIVHQRYENNNGGKLVHLTTWGESENLRRKWMKERFVK